MHEEAKSTYPRKKMIYSKVITFLKNHPKITLYEFNLFLEEKMGLTSHSGRSKAVARMVDLGMIKKSHPFIIYRREFEEE